MCTIQRNILNARRWLSLFLVCCFILCGIGGIYQRAQAVVGMTTAAISIIIAGLAAIGITFVSTGVYDSLSDYVGSLLNQYAASQSLTAAQIFNGTQEGVSGAGKILLNNRWVTLINGFAAWLKLQYNLANDSTKPIVSPGTSIAGYTVYQLPIRIDSLSSGFQDMQYAMIESTSPAVAILVKYAGNDHDYLLRVLSEEPGQYRIQYIKHNTNTVENTRTFNLKKSSSGLYYSSDAYSTYDYRYFDVSGFTSYSQSDYDSLLNGSDNEIDYNNLGIDINTGTITLPVDDPLYTNNDGAVLDVDAPWASTLPQITGSVIPRDWTAGHSGTPSIAYDSVPAIQDQINPEGSQVMNDDPDSYAVPGLQSVFPFCIPFDIYNLLSALAADPVAPSFTWRFYVPRVCDETFTVDLSPFDTVAQIVRTVELLAFIVGLAMVTRERFLRG